MNMHSVKPYDHHFHWNCPSNGETSTSNGETLRLEPPQPPPIPSSRLSRAEVTTELENSFALVSETPMAKAGKSLEYFGNDY